MGLVNKAEHALKGLQIILRILTRRTRNVTGCAGPAGATSGLGTDAGLGSTRPHDVSGGTEDPFEVLGFTFGTLHFNFFVGIQQKQFEKFLAF